MVKVKLSLCLIKHRHEDIWRSGVLAPTFLTSSLDKEKYLDTLV
jgi:hypothetical protein